MHIKQTLACRELGISEKVTMVSHLSSLIPKVCQIIQLSKVPVCALSVISILALHPPCSWYSRTYYMI